MLDAVLSAETSIPLEVGLDSCVASSLLKLWKSGTVGDRIGNLSSNFNIILFRLRRIATPR